MSLRYIDSFDHLASGDLTEKYHSMQGAIIRAGAGRRGTNCLETDAGQWVMLTLGPQPRWIIGFAMRYTTWTLGAGAFVDVSAAGTRHLTLAVTPEGFLQAQRGPGGTVTVLGTSLQALHTNIYYYIETSFLVSPTAGEVIVHVDGVEWLHLTGINTEAIAGVLPNAVRLGAESSTAGLVNCQHDDLYICDGTGAAPYNTFLGDCRIDVLRPNADGTYSAWTPSSGTAHYPMVDEPTPNDDTDYVSALTGAMRDSYQLEPLPTMPSPEVLAVQACLNARKEDVDEILIRPLLVSGGITSVASTVHELNASYKYALDLWTADPNGGVAWTEASVNSLQVGMERP